MPHATPHQLLGHPCAHQRRRGVRERPCAWGGCAGGSKLTTLAIVERARRGVGGRRRPGTAAGAAARAGACTVKPRGPAAPGAGGDGSTLAGADWDAGCPCRYVPSAGTATGSGGSAARSNLGGSPHRDASALSSSADAALGSDCAGWGGAAAGGAWHHCCARTSPSGAGTAAASVCATGAVSPGAGIAAGAAASAGAPGCCEACIAPHHTSEPCL